MYLHIRLHCLKLVNPREYMNHFIFVIQCLKLKKKFFFMVSSFRHIYFKSMFCKQNVMGSFYSLVRRVTFLGLTLPHGQMRNSESHLTTRNKVL